jgi:ABC-type polysaccharide/polyol phosphate export permease
MIQLVRYRTLILQLLRRDMTTRYKRSVLGVAWTMLNPLGTMLVMTIVFSAVFGGDRGYPAYILSGLMAWNFFSQTTTACMVNMVWGGSLLHRIYIPRASFAMAAIGTGIVNQLLYLVVLIPVMLVTGVMPTWTLVYLPLAMLVMVGFSLGIGLLLSSFAVYFPDVAEMYTIVLQALVYMTPVFYKINIIPAAYRGFVLHLNPMVGMLNLYRLPLLNGTIPGWQDFWPSALVALVVLGLGWWFFSSRSDEFAYRV